MKKVLFIDLQTQEHTVKSVLELGKYIGGVGVGLKLLLDHITTDPIIFSIGPLNGAFPYASKTSIVFHSEGLVEDIYVGGALSHRIKASDIDSIVITNKSPEPVFLDIQNERVTFLPTTTDIDSLGLPGKRSNLHIHDNKALVDDYFTTPENLLEKKLQQKNLFGFNITGTKIKNLQNIDKYEEIFDTILKRNDEMTVEKSTFPSCAGCPMGCSKSKVGELGGNVLLHSLVSCAYAKNIYSSVGVIFSCLNVLGYDYTHEDIEILPNLVEKVLGELS